MARGPNKGPRAVWDAASDAKLVECLDNHKKNGRMGSNSSWHKDVWSDAEKYLAQSEERSGGAKKTAESCHNRWTSLKKDYVQVKKLCDKSGFGWDEATQLVTASENVWNLLIQTDKPLGKWRKTSFPLYDKIHDLVVGTVATGEGVFRPGRDFTPPSSPARDAQMSSDPPTGDDLEAVDTSDGDVNPESQPNPDVGTSQVVSAASAQAPVVETVSAGVNTRKRPAEDVGESSSKHSHKNRTAVSLDNMAKSIDNIAEAVKHAGGDPSPVHRKAAIKIIEDDGELSDGSQLKIFKAIRHDVAIADFVMGIEAKSKRTLYLKSELEDL